MSKIIIGKKDGVFLRTNAPTSEKFSCQALKDQQKKKEQQERLLQEELSRRNNDYE